MFGRCQSKVGFGVPTGTPTYVTIVRADLSSTSVLPSRRVPSIRMPLLKNPSTLEYFSCCGEDDLCKVFLKSAMDLDQAHFAAGSFYVKCTNNVTGALYGRRLLETGVQACFGGQYNDERGNDVCYTCPQGITFFALPKLRQICKTDGEWQGHRRRTPTTGSQTRASASAFPDTTLRGVARASRAV